MKHLLPFFLLFAVTSSYAQVFNAGVLGGVSASQVEGDGFGGYKKAGAIIGGFTNTAINEKWEAQFEIYYIGKGSQRNPKPDKGDFAAINLHLNYIEIPVLVKYNYKKFDFELGLYYAYLLNVSLEDQFGKIDVQNQPFPFKKYDIGGFLGVQYELIENLFINVRSKNSLLPIRDFNTQDQNIGLLNKLFNRGWYNLDINFSLRYQFGKTN